MLYLNELTVGQKVKDIYLCKKIMCAKTKAGKDYWTVTLQDKTGSLDAKIWEPSSSSIDEFDAMDYIWVTGDVTDFMGNLQMNIRQVRKADENEYDSSDYVPTTDRDIDEMYHELIDLIQTISTPCLKQLLMNLFANNEEFKKTFCFHSAAKSVHHGFVGGLLEHTLSVAKLCDFYTINYPYLNRDLLLTAAMCHDIGKVKELSPYPLNDYTDEGQLLGHIIIGAEMVKNEIQQIPDFPQTRANELIHCILAHHGQLEYGSPKKPAIAEALALSYADNTDAKIETMKEALAGGLESNHLNWQGYNRFLETNIRNTSQDE